MILWFSQKLSNSVPSRLSELVLSVIASLSFQFFSLAIYRFFSVRLSANEFGLLGLWLTANTAVSVFTSSPVSALALRFSSVRCDYAASSFSALGFPPYLTNLLRIFLLKYLTFFSIAPLCIILAFHFGKAYLLFLFLLSSFIYGLAFGFLIILLGFLQGLRRRFLQFLVVIVDGSLKLLLITLFSSIGLPFVMKPAIVLSFSSLFSLAIVFVVLPIIIPDLFSPRQSNLFYSVSQAFAGPGMKGFDHRESEHLKAATLFGYLIAIQSFCEIYIGSIFYGLGYTANLLVLLKFVYAPSVFAANSFLAYVSPMLSFRAEQVYAGACSPDLLSKLLRLSPAVVLASSVISGFVAFAIGPTFLRFLFDSRFDSLAPFFPWFVFSGFLATLSYICIPIVDASKGAFSSYKARAIVSLFSLVSNMCLAPALGLLGATISTTFSALLAYTLLSLRYVFFEELLKSPID